jgi:hypothetical protein
MANISENAPKLPEEQVSQPSFPNTRWMKMTTDFSRNPGTFDDVFKKIKGQFSLSIDLLKEKFL